MKLNIKKGERYHYWEALEDQQNGAGGVLCKCVGCNKNTRRLRATDLKRGQIRSCGCQTIETRNESIRKANRERYGVDYYTQLKEMHEKSHQTNLQKYGVEYPNQSSEIMEKMRQKNLEHWGVEWTTQSENMKDKSKKACLEKYGVESYAKTSERKEKTTKTCLEKYGVDSYRKTEEFKIRYKETMLKKYGVEYPAQRPGVNISKSSFSKHSVKTHWKTGEEVFCVSSYESRVVDYLNNNRIDFEWQCKVFKLSTGLVAGKTYRPDLYLVTEDKWIEIKGYWRGNAKEKWDEFHLAIHPNSEVWDQPKLKELKIL